jgi:hypothetical protein
MQHLAEALIVFAILGLFLAFTIAKRRKEKVRLAQEQKLWDQREQFFQRPLRDKVADLLRSAEDAEVTKSRKNTDLAKAFEKAQRQSALEMLNELLADAMIERLTEMGLNRFPTHKEFHFILDQFAIRLARRSGDSKFAAVAGGPDIEYRFGPGVEVHEVWNEDADIGARREHLLEHGVSVELHTVDQPTLQPALTLALMGALDRAQ